VSQGLFHAAIILKDLPTLIEVRNDPAMLKKAADKYGITPEWAAARLDWEIEAKRAGL
jgi:hypothetical protein